jgi:hypothetical protein
MNIVGIVVSSEGMYIVPRRAGFAILGLATIGRVSSGTAFRLDESAIDCRRGALCRTPDCRRSFCAEEVGSSCLAKDTRRALGLLLLSSFACDTISSSSSCMVNACAVLGFLFAAGGLRGFTSLKEALNSVVKSMLAVVSPLALYNESRRCGCRSVMVAGHGVFESRLDIITECAEGWDCSARDVRVLSV